MSFENAGQLQKKGFMVQKVPRDVFTSISRTAAGHSLFARPNKECKGPAAILVLEYTCLLQSSEEETKGGKEEKIVKFSSHRVVTNAPELNRTGREEVRLWKKHVLLTTAKIVPALPACFSPLKWPKKQLHVKQLLKLYSFNMVKVKIFKCIPVWPL